MKLNNDFKEKLNKLQDDVDSKEAQIAILESEMQDATTPSNLLIEIKSAVMDMLFDVVKFEKSKGVSEKSKDNKSRLETLLDKIDAINKVANMAYNLKGINRKLHAAYQLLRIENSELKAELQKIADAEKFLAAE